ncbi:heavy metal translocating P-type ATPase [Gracilinema caldarium]|uniref:P-type Zn(2+) transporter n=1 Tax=Gracilinema caldarium (strain ATCC 51460 / DSM 7334 / H1) TaxID=744872 RepID=F8F349_GRAC1|nr:heavy metal translocating P-type ATPase [Gracilinema caldarium]AEJ20375.1 heavy metal translocating P-type ATPase [Gracilinema caldarium DSM 7334]
MNDSCSSCGCGAAFDIQDSSSAEKSLPVGHLTETQIAEARTLALAFLGTIFGILLSENLLSIPYGTTMGLIMLMVTYGAAAWPVFRGAWQNLRRGFVFDELFLMSIASLGAIALGAWEEAVGVMVFYRIGEFFQDYAVHRSRRSIEALLNLRPDQVRVKRNGTWIASPPEQVEPGELLLLRAGERLALDGLVAEGTGTVDTSAVTGESVPRPAEPGQVLLGGYVLTEGTLTVQVTEKYEHSTLNRVLHLIESAQQRKAPVELFVTRFARFYTPVVVGIALIIAVVPPLLLPGARFYDWLYRALIMLVISCPCAFVLSVPLTYFAGLGGAAKRGILLKGAAVLDRLVHVQRIVFDKTGTLTTGKFQVSKIDVHPNHSEAQVLAYAAAATAQSNHPLAQAVQRHWKTQSDTNPVYDEGSYYEIPGHGSLVTQEGTEILAGNDRLLHLKSIPHECSSADATVIHVAYDGSIVGTVHLEDQIKADAPRVIRELRDRGVEQVALFTGDGPGPAHAVGRQTGVTEVHHSLLPEDKLERFESLLQQSSGGTTAFVGDGINDGPVLARSDVGIAMGRAGSDLAIEQADMVLMTDDLSRIPEAIDRARKTRRIVWQNILFALLVKIAVMVLGALGLATMWMGVLADVGVALLAVLNALRALK